MIYLYVVAGIVGWLISGYVSFIGWKRLMGSFWFYVPTRGTLTIFLLLGPFCLFNALLFNCDLLIPNFIKTWWKTPL